MDRIQEVATKLRRANRFVEPPANAAAYRVDDAAAMLGIGRVSLYKLVRKGQLRMIKIAGRTLVPRSEIERLTAVGGEA
jgi:excisionase family DNA binding protein